MMNQSSGASQSAGDDAVQINARRDVTFIQSGITEERAREIALELIESRLVPLTAEAMAVATQRATELVSALFSSLHQRNWSDYDKFGDPRVQAALFSAQSGYAEKGTDELRKALTELMSRIVMEPRDSVSEAILRQAIDCAPKLTSRQLNGLSVLSTLANTTLTDAPCISALTTGLHQALSPYYGSMPQSALDYRFMASVGACIQFYGPSIYDKLYNTYKSIAYRPFRVSDIPDERRSEMKPFVQNIDIDDNPDAELFLMKNTQDALKAWDGTISADQEGDANIWFARKYRDHLLDILTLEQFTEEIRNNAPELAGFLDQLDACNATHFDPTPVGIMLGGIEQETRHPSTPSIILGLFGLSELPTPSPEAG